MGKDIVYQLLFIFIRLTVVWWIQLVKFQSSRTRTPTIIVSWAFKNLHNSCFQKNCVKSVQIRSFYWSVVSSIQTGNGKIRTGKKLCIWTLFTQRNFLDGCWWTCCYNQNTKLSIFLECPGQDISGNKVRVFSKKIRFYWVNKAKID